MISDVGKRLRQAPTVAEPVKMQPTALIHTQSAVEKQKKTHHD